MTNLTKNSVIKIAQITSQHDYTDARIREKECFSLVSAGYDVTLVAPDAPDMREGDLKICGFKKSNGRIKRITIGLWRLYKKTINLEPDIVHFHDPDVILIGVLFKLKGKKVIFDVHENFPNLAYDRAWVPKIAKWPLSMLLKFCMKLSGILFDGIVVATPSIAKMFPNSKTVVVRNMSRLDIFNDFEKQLSKKPLKICYVGGMSEERGFSKMLDAISAVNKEIECELLLAGNIPIDLMEVHSKNPGWKFTKKLGFLSRKEVAQLYSECTIGLVILSPTKNHIESLPIKMFEYMAAKLPVVASNFPLWIQLVEENKCGICVEPNNVEEIANAILLLLKSPDKVNAMGVKGNYFAATKYNWTIEEENLLNFYSKILF